MYGYGAGARPVAVAAGAAVWSRTGQPPVPLRWVLIGDPQGTCAAPAQILAWFVPRGQREVTVAEVRRHLGVETPRQGSEGAIRASPFAITRRIANHDHPSHRR